MGWLLLLVFTWLVLAVALNLWDIEKESERSKVVRKADVGHLGETLDEAIARLEAGLVELDREIAAPLLPEVGFNVVWTEDGLDRLRAAIWDQASRTGSTDFFHPENGKFTT